MPTITLPPKIRIQILQRVERHFLAGITRLTEDFAWHEDLRRRLESLLEGRMAIYDQAKEEYVRERGVGLEEWL